MTSTDPADPIELTQYHRRRAHAYWRQHGAFCIAGIMLISGFLAACLRSWPEWIATVLIMLYGAGCVAYLTCDPMGRAMAHDRKAYHYSWEAEKAAARQTQHWRSHGCQ